jgi:hypothetical protein
MRALDRFGSWAAFWAEAIFWEVALRAQSALIFLVARPVRFLLRFSPVWGTRRH